MSYLDPKKNYDLFSALSKSRETSQTINVSANDGSALDAGATFAFSINKSLPIAPIPEPASAALVLLSLAVCLFGTRRRK